MRSSENPRIHISHVVLTLLVVVGFFALFTGNQGNNNTDFIGDSTSLHIVRHNIASTSTLETATTSTSSTHVTNTTTPTSATHQTANTTVNPPIQKEPSTVIKAPENNQTHSEPSKQPKTPSNSSTASSHPSTTGPEPSVTKKDSEPFSWPAPSPKPEQLEDLPLTPEHLFNRKTIVAPQRYLKTSYRKAKAVDHEGPSALLLDGAVLDLKDAKIDFLCRINIGNRCYSRYPAENVNQTFAFCPIYSTQPSKHELLYYRHQQFIAYMKSFGLQTVVLEAIYPGQDYKVTQPGREPWEIQLQIKDTFYYRENLLNVAIRKNTGFEYIIWIDAHHMFENHYWWEEAIVKMDHYGSIQLYQMLAHLSLENNSTIPWCDLAGVQYSYVLNRDVRNWVWAAKGLWNGNAVAMSRENYEKVGYIIDDCIAGCCDCAFNYANMVDYWDRIDIYGEYGKQLMPWILNARKTLGGSVDVIRGHAFHIWHEHYFDWGIYLDDMTKNFYDIKTELYRDENYTLHVKEGSPLLNLFKREWIN